MTATATSVTREVDAAGDKIKGFIDASARVVQAVVIDPEVGAGVFTHYSTGNVGEVAVLVDATARRFVRADVNVVTTAPADIWLMVFDKATAPVGADVPIWRAKVGGGIASIDLGSFPGELTLGLGLALSTTIDTLTLAGANDAFFTADWAA